MSNSSFSTSRWMRDLREKINNKTLAQIAMPGSHDAGMSHTHGCTYGGSSDNTKTQKLNIKKQLEAGVRYFDLRPVFRSPVIGSLKFTCGHFSEVPLIGYQGCLGEELDSITDGVQKFLYENPHELIILDFSHYLSEHPLKGVGDFDHDVNLLINYIEEKLGTRLIRLLQEDKLLGNYTISELLNYGNVLVRYSKILASEPRKGIFAKDMLEIYDEYSGTNELGKMVQDQWDKYSELYNIPAKNYHFLVTQKYSTTLPNSYSNLTVIKQIAKSSLNFSLRVNLVKTKDYYIAGQSSNKTFFIRKIEKDGKLGSSNLFEQTWQNYYDFLGSYKGYESTYLIGYCKAKKLLFIQTILSDGKLGNETCTVTFNDVFDSLCVFEISETSFLVTHNKNTLQLNIYELKLSGEMPEYLNSTILDCFYDTLAVFSVKDKFYLAGQNEASKKFSIHPISSELVMAPPPSSKWSHKASVSPLTCYRSTWSYYYKTFSKFDLGGRYFISGQTEANKLFYIDELTINSEGNIELDNIYCRKWQNMYASHNVVNIENNLLRIVHCLENKNIFSERYEIFDQFLLSWTLTQGDAESVLSNAKISGVTSLGFNDIEDLAKKANQALSTEIAEKIQNGLIRQGKVPNIVYLDFCNVSLSETIIALNLL